jgi:hypothetical protein
MIILELFLLHGAAGGWDELVFLIVPLAIIFALGMLTGRGKGEQQPEQPAPADDADAPGVGASARSAATGREEGEA